MSSDRRSAGARPTLTRFALADRLASRRVRSALAAATIALGTLPLGGCGNSAPAEKESASAKSLDKMAAGHMGGATTSKATASASAAAAPGEARDSAPKSGRNDDALGDADDTKKNRILFDHVMFDPAKPSFFIPCIKILSALYGRALDGKDFEVEFSVMYTSRGQEVTKTATVKLADMTKFHETEEMVETEDGKGKHKEKYIEVGIPLDGGDTPPDRDTRFSGTAKLYKVKDKTRAAKGDGTLAPTPATPATPPPATPQ